MKVPAEIAEKAKRYQELNKEAQRLYEELEDWLNENTGADAVFITDIFVAEKPKGKLQNGDEYCSQSSYGYSGDSFVGTYYLPVEGSSLYLGYGYDC